MAADDLRRRLRRLGVTTGRDFVPKPRPQLGPDIDALVDGQTVERASGACFRIRRLHEPGTVHGAVQLSEWLAQDVTTLAQLSAEETLSQTALPRFVFLDAETTGLGGGALAFLVGIGFFNQAGRFEVHQLFLRDPAEEMAMLALLSDVFAPGTALVTFNGRTFDVPLLADRYVLARRRSPLSRLPNLDLLPPARRLWRRRLSSCSLRSLEESVLGVQRTSQDVPGALIPMLYRQYLETRDARQMVRVLYHNEMDLLSMVALAVTLCQIFERPDAAAQPIDDQLSLARWYYHRGMLRDSETAYRVAAHTAPDAESRYDALVGLASLLKQTGRHDEAVSLWAAVADLGIDTLGHEEIAKYHEWRTRDLTQALDWTERAIRLAESWRPGWRGRRALNELHHRRGRLLRKLSK